MIHDSIFRLNVNLFLVFATFPSELRSKFGVNNNGFGFCLNLFVFICFLVTNIFSMKDKLLTDCTIAICIEEIQNTFAAKHDQISQEI